MDERGFRMAKIIRDSRKANRRLTLSQFKEIAKEQLQLVQLDEERAVKALPKLIRPGEPEFRRGAGGFARAAPGPRAVGHRGKERGCSGRGGAWREADEGLKEATENDRRAKD